MSVAGSEPSASTELPADFRPKTGTIEQWNAAYVRVEEYLRAHRVHHRLHQVRLIQRILERAAARHAADPGVEPTVLAAEEMEAQMDAWFAEMLQAHDRPTERVAVDGRVALLLSDGMQKWPDAFLDERAPEDFSRAMRDSSVRAGPDMAVSSMVPRAIELGPISEAAGETLERFERWPLLRAGILWVMFLAILVALFDLTR